MSKYEIVEFDGKFLVRMKRRIPIISFLLNNHNFGPYLCPINAKRSWDKECIMFSLLDTKEEAMRVLKRREEWDRL